MSPIHKGESASSERKRFIKSIKVAAYELQIEGLPIEEKLDLSAYIIISLGAIASSVDVTATAWEKRDYWVKADNFRREWHWVEHLEVKAREAILEKDWGSIVQTVEQTLQVDNKLNIPPKHHMGRPWSGAWDEFTKKTGLSEDKG